MCQRGDEITAWLDEGLIGFECNLNFTWLNQFERNETYKRGSYDEKWNTIILTNPQSSTVASRSSSGQKHSWKVFCCPNGKIAPAKLCAPNRPGPSIMNEVKRSKWMFFERFSSASGTCKNQASAILLVLWIDFGPRHSMFLWCWNLHHWHRHEMCWPCQILHMSWRCQTMRTSPQITTWHGGSVGARTLHDHLVVCSSPAMF